MLNLLKKTEMERENNLFPSTVEVEGKIFKVKVEFLKKKNSSASIKEDTFHFRLPKHLSYKKSKEHFDTLLNNLMKKVEKAPHIFEKESFKEVINQGKFYFGGEEFKIIRELERKKIHLNDNIIYVGYDDPEVLEKKIINLLMKKFQPRLEKYFYTLNRQTYNFPVKGFKIKNLKSKWGHCTHDNEIMINLKLLNAPIDVLNYVIFHELSHVKIKNHSDRFWKEVEKFCPQHKKIRKYLREHPPKTFNIENE